MGAFSVFCLVKNVCRRRPRLLLLFFVSALGQNLPTDPAGKLLPDKIGSFRAAGPAKSQDRVQFADSNQALGVTS